MYNIIKDNKYVCTFKEWLSINIPINEILLGGSIDNIDRKELKLPDDGWIDEPIGVSNMLSYNVLYNIINNITNETYNINSKTVYCAIRCVTDKVRRGDQSINRNIISQTLSKNKIFCRTLGEKQYLETILESKFTISPEGNGIDTHRTWEALYLKSIPVCEDNPLTRKKMEGLPVLYTKDYSEITPDYLESKYNEFLSEKFNFNKLLLNNYPIEIVRKIKRRSNYWYGRKNQTIWWPLNIKNNYNCNNIMNNLSTITVTNTGYCELTNNSLETFKRLETGLKVKIYCMDKECQEKYKDNYDTSLLEFNFSNTCEYMKENWAIVTMQKLVAIYTELNNNSDFVFLFDGDIVFKNINAITEIYSIMNENKDIDLICQNEYQGRNSELNSGFLLIRKNQKTLDFFNPDNYIVNTIDKIVKYKNDQHYLNHNAKKLNIHVLPNDKFPNGKFFYDEKPLNPYMIHFNFVKGPQKKGKMQGYKCWVI